MITGKGNTADSNSSHSSSSSSSTSSGSSGSHSSTTTTSTGPTTGYNTNTHTQGYSNSGYGTTGAGVGTATGIAGHHHGSVSQTTTTTTGSTGTTGLAANSGVVAEDGYITRSEEQLRVGKEAFESGRAQLGKHVTTETVSTTVPVSKERVVVEREPITSADIQSGNLRAEIGEASYEMRLKEERAIAEKEVVPIEKVRMRKEVETVQQEVGGELRKEHIDFNDGVNTGAGYQKTDTTTTTTTGTTGALPTTTNTGYGTTNAGQKY
jgi:stress response protein YsnF